MAHIRLEYMVDTFGELDLVDVDVRVGPNRANLRDAGRLQMHASELNALDRMLSTGHSFEQPGTTYEIKRVDGARQTFSELVAATYGRDT